MIPTAFEYRTPETVEEALALLSKYREDAKVLAGGQSLIPMLKQSLCAPRVVVDLRRIPGLAAIEAVESGTRLGALATYRDVETSPLVKARCPLVSDVSGVVADLQVRSCGTVVGALCQADPAGDHPAVLLVLDAEVEIASPRGDRVTKVADFLQGAMEVALEPDELVRAVCIPQSHAVTCAYRRQERDASGYALAGAAAQLRLSGGLMEDVRVGVTGVASRSFRAGLMEERLRGKDVRREEIVAAASGITRGREVIEDSFASAEYRSWLAEVVAVRAVLAAVARAATEGSVPS
jgi:carbon-monoxide dehydrogenase medium subunit